MELRTRTGTSVIQIDPSFEQKAEYDQIPDILSTIHRKWSVGIVMLWYPVLQKGFHAAMVDRLQALFPDGVSHRVDFPPVKEGHGMTGSGLFILNPPYGLDEELARLSRCFARLTAR